MFKVAFDTAVPGFRVGLPDEPPGFNIDENGSPRPPSLAAPDAASFGDPYGNVLQATAPTGFRPVGMLDSATNGVVPTQYHPYVPVAGDTPLQDPLRQAVNRATNPYANVKGLPLPDPLRQAVDRASSLPADPGQPATTSLSPSQIGGLIGGVLGGTLGSFINPHVGRIGAGIGGGLGMILGGEYGNGNAGRAISTLNSSGLAGVPGM
jgi:hypothetical protein